MSSEFDFMSATQMRRYIVSKAISPVDLTRRALERAEDSQSTLNAFFVIDAEKAMATARRSEEAIMKGTPRGLLHGLPFSAKDLMAVAGLPYASGSIAMKDNVAAVDAPAVARAKAAGAVLIGKTTTSEFGCKPVGDSPLTGITRHPWNMRKTPGGSSAGAAASVAAGITPIALGTDGGGSIRIPCSLTGSVGIKGHFGRVPVWPVSATPSLAHVGPIARNVEDAALMFTAIAGHDPRDPTSIAGPGPDLLSACKASPADLRVAWSPTLGYARPDPEVVQICADAAKTLEELGCNVEEVDSVFDEDPAALWTAEFYAGVGTRLRDIIENRGDILDPAVKDILRPALDQELKDYYSKVFARFALRDKIVSFFETYDILLSPVLPVTSLDAGKNIPDHLTDRNLVSWVFYTYPFNLTGNPAATVCAGVAKDGMPVGLQVVGRGMNEYDVVRIIASFERSQPQGHNIRM